MHYLPSQPYESMFRTVICREFSIDEVPNHTKIVTCFNHSLIIREILSQVVSNSTEPFDLHIIDDSSEDDTLEVVSEFVETLRSSLLRQLLLSQARVSQFETQCDDYGIRSSRTRFAILIQADILITDSGFDKVLISPLQRWRDLIAISGRGTEPIGPIQEAYRQSSGSSFSPGLLGTLVLRLAVFRRLLQKSPKFSEIVSILIGIEKFWANIFTRGRAKAESSSEVPDVAEVFPDVHRFNVTSKAGYLDASFSVVSNAEQFRGRIWISDTVTRGPLAIDREKYCEVGGFDTNRFFLAFDDHDLCVRSFVKHGYRVGFTPVNLRSDLAWGSTRKSRSRKQTSLLLAKSAPAIDALNGSSLLQQGTVELGNQEIRELDHSTESWDMPDTNKLR